MAYDRELADRIRQCLAGEPNVSEMAMFGGLAFLVNGNMAVSASGQGGLLLRVDPADTDSLVARPGVRRFEMRGRQMDGWLHVAPSAHDEDEDEDEELAAWVRRGVDYARSLPPK